MERNTVVGIVLLGLLLTVYTIVNQPTDEEIKVQQQKELAIKKQQAEAAKKSALAKEKTIAKDTIKDSTDTIQKPILKAETVRIESAKLAIDLSTKGGQIDAVYLKEFNSYSTFSSKLNGKTSGNDPGLCLFNKGDQTTGIQVIDGNKSISTSSLFFTKSTVTPSKVILTAKTPAGNEVVQTYSINKDSYTIDYSIKMIGFKGNTGSNVLLNWNTNYLKTERLLDEQRRVSTICYNQKKEGFSYLSEASDDALDAEDDLTWIAYKQSYFSSILRPEKPILKNGSKMAVQNYTETDPKFQSHIKNYKSALVLGTIQGGETTFNMNWFFGPNDYEVLQSMGQDYDIILNFGWGLFRWINIYAVQPIFSLLVDNGISVGIAILLLTLILKLILMPVQWKMFTSSVKMKILKPEIDELTARFPNKEDAMKKQMEMMNLYKESGASPLAGCVPMLIQMPILLAVFRFFPAAFELRQQSFLWAEDLSSFDSILDLSFNIPLYGDHVSLFTLLMAGVTLLYTFMNSGNMQQPQQPGMPNMKIIMYIFPFMMIFFFNNYSSGLSYYYFISTLFSILIMLAIKYFFVDEEKLKLKMADRKAKAVASGGKEKKKSRFQEKLEEMQRKQLEMNKNKKK
ncbi:MAG: membrane protein insertase YidC [Crocinitomicaceae bacterium]|nr:membrane protein insertase YidC [Crocinitomicaceae bacterium]MCF8411125.1 membrane protein insertase YidC [Crocinitomicaceae bacterium]